MATLKQIREGLKANLGTLSNCQVSAYELSNPTPPCLEVFPDPGEGIEYHQAGSNGLAYWVFSVRGTVAATTDIGGQMLLDEWLAPSGSSSVKEALESDKTLGGVVQDVHVRSCTGYQEYAKQGLNGSFFAAVWTVLVLV